MTHIFGQGNQENLDKNRNEQVPISKMPSDAHENCSSHISVDIETKKNQPEADLPIEKMSDEFSCYEFRARFESAINPKEAQGGILFAAISRMLANYHLRGFYSIEEVLNEAYERGQKANQRKRIENVPAWIRRTSHNIISEWSRRDSRTTSDEERIANYAAPVEPVLDEDLAAKLRLVRIAAQNLQPRSQRILQLKVVENLPWREIQEILRAEGYGDHTPAALRQQKVRALAKLRKLFHELEEGTAEQ